MHYLISFAVLTTVLSCHHRHDKVKYGHNSQFGPNFNDFIYDKNHHTHIHGHVAIINTQDPAAALDKLSSITIIKNLPLPSSTPTPTPSTTTRPVSVNQKLLSPEKTISSFSTLEQKAQHRDNVEESLSKDNKYEEYPPSQPLVDVDVNVPFSVKVIKGYFSSG